MPTVTLQATSEPSEPYAQKLCPGAIKYCAYIKGLLDLAPDSDLEIPVPDADAAAIRFICEFFEEHQNDEDLPEGWEKLPPRQPTQWDKEHLEPFVGMQLTKLAKAVSFLGSKLILNTVTLRIGQILITKNKQEIQEYFGIFREFTEEETAQVKARYPNITFQSV